jgi:ABC-type glycerol-3-phosphate transport system substrate-binding protein
VHLQFWHFWSEPLQKAALQKLIDAFHRQHPSIKIDCTELQWSEGRTKLILAFSQSQSPDIIHFGLEWAPELIGANLLHQLPKNSISDSALPALQSALKDSTGAIWAYPWTVNTRVFMYSAGLAQDSIKEWQDLLKLKNLQWGVNSTEPHNVLKKALPVLWGYGSQIFRSLPLWQSYDSNAVIGLDIYVQLADKGRIEQSRILDDLFLSQRINAWISGQWLLSALDTAKHRIAPRMPGSTGFSILSGDCIGISRNSAFADSAIVFLTYLCSAQNTSLFCNSLPDAGFPASIQSALPAHPLKKSFFLQTRNSVPLPSVPYFLDAEQIAEEEIMQAVYKKKTPAQAIASARNRTRLLENK